MKDRIDFEVLAVLHCVGFLEELCHGTTVRPVDFETPSMGWEDSELLLWLAFANSVGEIVFDSTL